MIVMLIDFKFNLLNTTTYDLSDLNVVYKNTKKSCLLNSNTRHNIDDGQTSAVSLMSHAEFKNRNPTFVRPVVTDPDT